MFTSTVNTNRIIKRPDAEDKIRLTDALLRARLSNWGRDRTKLVDLDSRRTAVVCRTARPLNLDAHALPGRMRRNLPLGPPVFHDQQRSDAMSRGFPSMTALLGLLAVAGYQPQGHRRKC